MKLGLWKVLTVATAILLICGLANGQGKRTYLTVESVGISIVLPVGLQPFSEEQMALVREKGESAKFIYSDPQSDVIVVINTFGSGANEKGLPEVAEQIKTATEKQNANTEWLSRDYITMNGMKWLRLSFKEGVGADQLIDTYFVTDWAGEYVEFIFTSTVAKYENYKSAFERSAQSIQLELITKSMETNKGSVKRPRKKP